MIGSGATGLREGADLNGMKSKILCYPASNNNGMLTDMGDDAPCVSSIKTKKREGREGYATSSRLS